MKPWEIYSWQPAGWPQAHPAVIVSHPDRAGRKDPVEVLMCSTKRATRAALPHEVILDDADGLDWPTLCKCDVIYAVSPQQLGPRRGEVSDERRPAMVRTMIAAHGWAEVL